MCVAHGVETVGRFVWYWALLSAVVGVLSLAPWADAAPVLAAGIRTQAVESLLRADLKMRAGTRSAAGPDRTALAQFYRARGFRPVWIASPLTDEALAALGNSAADGLEPRAFHYPWLVTQKRFDTAMEAARYDLTLTASLLHYAHELRRGIVNPRRLDKLVGISTQPLDEMVAITRPTFDPASSLAAALVRGDFKGWLASLPPAHPEYADLKAALTRYREIVANGGWSKVPEVRKIKLKAGSPNLLPLERRLAATDPRLASAPPEDLEALEAAVKRFQARNGLAVDGVVGRKTIAALNISAPARVAQIEANMERWRWLPHRFPSRYVEANAADATLEAVDNGRVVLRSRVIAGKPRTPTAIFNGYAIALTIDPPWIVPASIARKEIMPKVRRDPTYLSTHHMIIVNGQLRQLPGADNALGYLKVDIPNKFSTYLHDTSSRELFARNQRHLSHGCIRVQKIRPLASWLLTGSVEKGLPRVNAAIVTGMTQEIALEKPVEIFVLYWTAIARDDGRVDFRPDIYGLDKALIAALAKDPRTKPWELGTSKQVRSAPLR